MNSFREKTAKIGIIGLGYVGMPLALASSEAGFNVIGFDIDPEKIIKLNSGLSYFTHIPNAAIANNVATGLFRATSDFSQLSQVDAIIICVPTPLTAQREPDLSYVVRTGEAIAPHLRRGQLIVLESTSWPGTTHEVLKPVLEATGLLAGVDFFLAFSPEREDPGNEHHSTTTIPKVVGADDPISRELATSFYEQIIRKVVPVSSARTAEAVKLTENIFRAVNIALVNELKVVYSAMGIDVWEVIDAAKTKPFGFMPFYPGPGLGGHCIPIDPFYLTWKAREYELSTRFIELAGEINTNMPRYVVERLSQAIDRRTSRGLRNAKILIVGIAYKKNISDIRESASLRLIDILEARGAVTSYFDPYVEVIPPTREHSRIQGRTSICWAPEVLKGFDAAVVATDHDNVDYAALGRHVPLVIDTRNVFFRSGLDFQNVEKA